MLYSVMLYYFTLCYVMLHHIMLLVESIFRRAGILVKATISFVLSVCSSAWPGGIFMKFCIFVFF